MGQPRSLSGSAGGMAAVAVAVAQGDIGVFDLTGKVGPGLVRTVNFNASRVRISGNGQVLAAQANRTGAQYEHDRSEALA